jgi:hypothetical protein
LEGREVVAGCSCTTINIRAGESINPWEHKIVNVALEAGSTYDHREEIVLVYLEDSFRRPLTFKLSATVRPELFVAPATISVGPVIRGSPEGFYITVHNYSSIKWSEIVVEGQPAWLTIKKRPVDLTGIEFEKFPPLQAWRILAQPDTLELPAGRHELTLILKAAGDDAIREQSIPCVVQVRDFIQVLPKTVVISPPYDLSIPRAGEGSAWVVFADASKLPNAQETMFHSAPEGLLNCRWRSTEGSHWELEVQIGVVDEMTPSEALVKVDFGSPEFDGLSVPVVIAKFR